MRKKIIVTIILVVAFAGVLTGVVFVAQKAKNQEQPSGQVVQHQSQDEKQAEQADEAQEPGIREMKPIDLQTVQHQGEANTDGWLTYASENKQFTIKYPADLFLREPGLVREGDSHIMSRDTVLVISDKEDAELQAIDPSEAVHIIISMPKKKEGRTLQEGVYGMMAGEEDLVSEVFVNGNKGYRIYSEKNKTIPLTYFFEKDEQVYSLVGVNYLEGDEWIESHRHMEEIILTFDFL